MNIKIKILIVFPIVLIIIFIVMAGYINFKDTFPVIDRQVTDLIPSGTLIKQENRIKSGYDLKSPIDFTFEGSQDSFPSISLDTLAHRGYNGNNLLSLTVISGKTRMAIIKGTVVKEGDIMDGMKIIKIEPDRVMLKNNNTSTWLYMEDAK